jgi:hypothetical protein
MWSLPVEQKMKKPTKDSLFFFNFFFMFWDAQVFVHMAADQYCGIVPKDGTEN